MSMLILVGILIWTYAVLLTEGHTDALHFGFDEGPDWHEDPFDAESNIDIDSVFDSVSSSSASLVNMSPNNWVSGKRYTALSFSSTEDQFVNVGINLATQMGSSSSLSVWIKTSTIGGISPDAGITGSKNGIVWGCIDSSGCICLSVHSVVIVTSTSPINDDEWHHVGFTRDSDTGLAVVYVDGQLEGASYGPVGMITEGIYTLYT